MVSTILLPLLCLFIFFILIVGLILGAMFKKVPENENWVVTRLGETTVQGPGRIIQIPLIDQVIRVDMGEKPTNIQDQTCITRDRAPVIIHMLVYSRAIAPVKYASQTDRQRQAFLHLASSTLKEMASARMLDQVLSDRDELGAVICAKLNGEIDPGLGMRIEKVKIMEVVVSKEILAAMPAPGEFPPACPACGAPLDDQGSQGRPQIKCAYCGFLIKL
jgi:regulator of protease activity HflC (stomatin/prohibitin superfamily)